MSTSKLNYCPTAPTHWRSPLGVPCGCGADAVLVSDFGLRQEAILQVPHDPCMETASQSLNLRQETGFSGHGRSIPRRSGSWAKTTATPTEAGQAPADADAGSESVQ